MDRIEKKLNSIIKQKNTLEKSLTKKRKAGKSMLPTLINIVLIMIGIIFYASLVVAVSQMREQSIYGSGLIGAVYFTFIAEKDNIINMFPEPPTERTVRITTQYARKLVDSLYAPDGTLKKFCKVTPVKMRIQSKYKEYADADTKQIMADISMKMHDAQNGKQHNFLVSLAGKEGPEVTDTKTGHVPVSDNRDMLEFIAKNEVQKEYAIVQLFCGVNDRERKGSWDFAVPISGKYTEEAVRDCFVTLCQMIILDITKQKLCYLSKVCGEPQPQDGRVDIYDVLPYFKSGTCGNGSDKEIDTVLEEARRMLDAGQNILDNRDTLPDRQAGQLLPGSIPALTVHPAEQ